MELEMWISRFLWLTETIYPTIIFFILSIVVTLLFKVSPETGPGHDVLLPLSAPLFEWAKRIFWGFTGTIFLCHLVRKYLF